MKKKSLVILSTTAILSMAIAGSIGAAVISASAATEITNGSGGATTEVTYKVDNAWTVTIPDSLEVGGAGKEVSASGVKIEPDTTLNVTVESTNKWTVQDSEGHSIGYELKSSGASNSGTALTDGETVLSVEAGNASGSATLTATVNDDYENYSTGGEEYTDTLTFTVKAE